MLAPDFCRLETLVSAHFPPAHNHPARRLPGAAATTPGAASTSPAVARAAPPAAAVPPAPPAAAPAAASAGTGAAALPSAAGATTFRQKSVTPPPVRLVVPGIGIDAPVATL